MQSTFSIRLRDPQQEGLGLTVLLEILNTPQFAGHESPKHPDTELRRTVHLLVP